MTTATDSTRTIVTGSKSALPARRAGSSRNREQLISWAFLAPFLLAFVLFLAWPIVHGLSLIHI